MAKQIDPAKPSALASAPDYDETIATAISQAELTTPFPTDWQELKRLMCQLVKDQATAASDLKEKNKIHDRYRPRLEPFSSSTTSTDKSPKAVSIRPTAPTFSPTSTVPIQASSTTSATGGSVMGSSVMHSVNPTPVYNEPLATQFYPQPQTVVAHPPFHDPVSFPGVAVTGHWHPDAFNFGIQASTFQPSTRVKQASKAIPIKAPKAEEVTPPKTQATTHSSSKEAQSKAQNKGSPLVVSALNSAKFKPAFQPSARPEKLVETFHQSTSPGDGMPLGKTTSPPASSVPILQASASSLGSSKQTLEHASKDGQQNKAVRDKQKSMQRHKSSKSDSSSSEDDLTHRNQAKYESVAALRKRSMTQIESSDSEPEPLVPVKIKLQTTNSQVGLSAQSRAAPTSAEGDEVRSERPRMASDAGSKAAAQQLPTHASLRASESLARTSRDQTSDSSSRPFEKTASVEFVRHRLSSLSIASGSENSAVSSPDNCPGEISSAGLQIPKGSTAEPRFTSRSAKIQKTSVAASSVSGASTVVARSKQSVPASGPAFRGRKLFSVHVGEVPLSRTFQLYEHDDPALVVREIMVACKPTGPMSDWADGLIKLFHKKLQRINAQ